MKYKYGTYFIYPKEYAKIISEINTNYFKYKNHKIAVHISYDLDGKCCAYFFENKGYNKYNIFDRIEEEE